ncbi:MAG: MFS transporter [bacterium]
MPERVVGDQRTPYWSLSSFYFVYFALLGATFPYWSLYLEQLGFDSVAIGGLLAIPMVTKIAAPLLWGWLADRSGRPSTVIRLGSALACLSFTLIFINQTLVGLAAAVFLYSFFWNAVLPQHEVITLKFLHGRTEYYSRVRVWGSIGFIVMVAGCGIAFDRLGIEGFPVVALLILLAIWLASLAVPTVRTVPHKSESIHFLRSIKTPVIMSFLLACTLLQVSHGVYYSFYSIYLEDAGYSRSLIGILWSIGVIAEVIVFLAMHKLMRGWSLRNIVLISLTLSAIRWLLIGHFADSLGILIVAQCFHAFTYGAYHSAAVEVIRKLFHDHHQGRGQAIYSGASFGVGGAIGSFLGGVIWTIKPIHSYQFAALASVLALVIVYIWMRDEKLN